MTEQTSATEAALKRLIWPLRLTRFGMIVERAAFAFWPLWSLFFVAIAAFAFGIAEVLSQPQMWGLVGAFAIAILWALVRGLRQFRMPSRTEALDRLDRTMPGRPISTLLDHPAIGADDPASQSVWAAHVSRMAARASEARAPQPDLRLSRRDPFALRYIAASALAMALLFGTLGRVADVGEAVTLGPGSAAASGPSWEGWVEPPLYTGLPSLYLNDIRADAFEAPAGSRISLRFYGAPGDITVETDVADLPVPNEPPALSQAITLERSGTLSIFAPSGARSWTISMRPDTRPNVTLEGALEGEPPGQMQLSFNATDDFGVMSGTASFRLDPAAADRRFGLTIDPEPRDPLVLDLPMPFRGSRTEFTEVMVEDLAQHPFANLPVTLTLTVVDEAGQIGTTSYDVPRLPGRRFFDPLANAIIELRRDLLWNRANASRAADLLRAITYHPEDDLDEGVYLQLRTAIRRLEAAIDSVSGETRDQVAEILWNAAIELEDGDLGSALERLQRAQERLSEAMRQGASDEEISELMQELREAMNDYMRELAENAEPSDGTDQPDQGERMEMSMADLDQMLRRIEELMQEGRMAEAQEMLNALQQMLENMEITQGEGGDGPQTPGQQSMQELQDTLRDQQDLSDDSFSELQEQFGGQPQGQPQPGQQQGQPGQRPGQEGQQPGQQGQGMEGQGDQPMQRPGAPQQPGDQQGMGQGGENGGMSLADRQEALRRQLEEQARRVPGTGTEDGDEAMRQLDEAGRAMDDAADALERGDLAGALDLQSDAMEALREGMSALGRALTEDEGREPGQGQAEGAMTPERPLQDPLGRQAGNAGSMGSDEDMEAREEANRRARDLLDELRRRSSEQERPQIELDYLRRLLEQF